VAKLFALPYPT